jgi:hypothetical protein
MTEPSLHAFVRPPHCNAKVKQTSDVNNKLNPGRSSCRRTSSKVAFGSLICFGTWNQSSTASIMTPPTGLMEMISMGFKTTECKEQGGGIYRLIQKHHLQLTFVVKAPPIKGPMIVANIKIAIHCDKLVYKFFRWLQSREPLCKDQTCSRPLGIGAESGGQRE